MQNCWFVLVAVVDEEEAPSSKGTGSEERRSNTRQAAVREPTTKGGPQATRTHSLRCYKQGSNKGSPGTPEKPNSRPLCTVRLSQSQCRIRPGGLCAAAAPVNKESQTMMLAQEGANRFRCSTSPRVQLGRSHLAAHITMTTRTCPLSSPTEPQTGKMSKIPGFAFQV